MESWWSGHRAKREFCSDVPLILMLCLVLVLFPASVTHRMVSKRHQQFSSNLAVASKFQFQNKLKQQQILNFPRISAAEAAN
jgi:hypothetical protein